jgi:hypothetical protein
MCCHGAKLPVMAKRSPERLYGRKSQGQKISLNRTPTGVWVIVGMAVFFVVGGLGISAFILVKALSVKKGVPALNDAPSGNAEPARSSPGAEGADAGVDHEKPIPAAVSPVYYLPLASRDPDEESGNFEESG